MENNKERCVWTLLRVAMGLTFLWAFIDKMFGLGFATKSTDAWLAGGSPTFGFLKFATVGPFASFYQELAGNIVVDWLFMSGLLFVGVTLTFGILMRLGSYIGMLMMLLMYTAGFLPPKNNPFIDEHIVYLIIMIGLTIRRDYCFGLGRWWLNTALVKKFKILE